MGRNEKKLFGTYCSIEFLNSLKQGELIKTRNYLSEHDVLGAMFGYNPIFAIPFENIQHFLVWSALSMPQHPQVLILFESDEYDNFNFVEWLYYIFDIRSVVDKPHNKLRTSSKLREFIVPSIKEENIVSILHISAKEFRESDMYFLTRLFGDLSGTVFNSLEGTKYEQAKELEVLGYEEFYTQRRELFDIVATIQTNPTKLKEKDISNLINRLKNIVFKIAQ